MIEWIVSSSVLILIVLAVRTLGKNRLSCRARYALWLLVLARLLIPVQLFTASWGMEARELPRSFTVRSLGYQRYAELELPTNGFDEAGKPIFESQEAQEQWSSFLDREPEGVPAGSSMESGASSDSAEAVWYDFRWSVADVLRAIWLAGAGIMAAVLLVANLRFAHRLKRRRIPFDAAECNMETYVAEELTSPCLVGVFHPVVYLTPESARDERMLRHVLAHETTHRLHGDCLWSLLRLAALSLHWYNPLVWLAVIVSKRDGELACDEATLARLGEDERTAYGETLLSLVRSKPSTRELLSASTAMTAGKKPMRERIETIAKHPRTKAVALLLAVTVLLTATVFAFSKGAPAPLTEEEALDALEASVEWWTDEHTQAQYVAFTIPEAYEQVENWGILIAGRAAYDDGMTMSRHYFEGEAWRAGGRYVIELSHLTELIMQASLVGQKGGLYGREINLLPETDTVYGDMTRSSLLSEELRRNWAEWDAMDQVTQSLQSRRPGVCWRGFGTWAEAAAYLGFAPWNPLENADWLAHRNYAGADIADPLTGVVQHAYLTWSGERDGTVTGAELSVGYADGNVRVILTVEQPRRSSEPEWMGAERMTLADGTEVLAKRDSGEAYDALNLYTFTSGAYYTVRLISHEGTDALDAPMSRVLGALNSFADQNGAYAGVEEYIGSVRARMTTATYYTGESNQERTANVLDTRIAFLDKDGELSGLAPDGTLELYNYLIETKLDVPPEQIGLAGGMYATEDGWFDLEGQGGHSLILLRHADGSVDALTDRPNNDDRGGLYYYEESAEELLYDFYVRENGLDLPLYTRSLSLGGENTAPAHRRDGDGWYLYVPIQAWYEASSGNTVRWSSQYNTGSTISIREASREEMQAERPQLAEGQSERFVEAPDGRIWLVWTQYDPMLAIRSDMTGLEPAILAAMANSFAVSAKPRSVSADTLFASISGGYWFLSGAGGWHTELEIYADGTFTGWFEDRDMETVYYSNFGGKLADARRVNDYTWSIRVTGLQTYMPAKQAAQEGERWIESEPYGLADADEILVYLPGAPVSALPEEFIRWYCAGLSYGRDQIGDTLPTVGLYNVNEQYGWFARSLIDNAVVEPLTADEVAAWAEVVSLPDEDGELKRNNLAVSCFFTSSYYSPRDLDLQEFLRYCPLGTVISNNYGTIIDEAERAAVIGTGKYYGEFVPTHRYRVSDINALLMQYAGITLDEMNTDWRSDERMLYLPEYDAFYNFTSDSGPGVFVPESGTRLGQIVTLLGANGTLRLRGTPDSFRIMSFTER